MRVGVVHRADHESPRRGIAGGVRVAMAMLLCGWTWSETELMAATTPPYPSLELQPSTPWSDAGSLDILELVPTSTSTPPKIEAIGRLNGRADPNDGTLGMGGVDLSWRPDERISIAMIAGGMMDRFDEGDVRGSGLDADSGSRDPLALLGGRTSAFDGLDFGGFSATSVTPFDSGRAMTPSTNEDRLRSMFMATRAIVKPGDGTSIGFVATHGGSMEPDRSLVGVDLGQQIGNHRVDVWIQQSLGSMREDAISNEDRMALGASLGGSIDSLRYRVGWTQIGESFESGLGRSGSGSANSLLGSMDWKVPIRSLNLIDRVEIGVAAVVDADAEFDPNKVDIKVDAIRFVTNEGHRLELGMVQQLRPDAIDGVGLSSQERYRMAVVSDPSSPFKVQGQVDLGEQGSGSNAIWNGTARWNPGGGFHLGGSVRAESRNEDLELRETILTSIDGGFKVGGDAAFQSSMGFDSARDRLSVRQSVGWSFQNNAALSIRFEQQLPISTASTDPVQIRASIGGKFEF